jgi:hypothetical protein
MQLHYFDLNDIFLVISVMLLVLLACIIVIVLFSRWKVGHILMIYLAIRILVGVVGEGRKGVWLSGVRGDLL